MGLSASAVNDGESVLGCKYGILDELADDEEDGILGEDIKTTAARKFQIALGKVKKGKRRILGLLRRKCAYTGYVSGGALPSFYAAIRLTLVFANLVNTVCEQR